MYSVHVGHCFKATCEIYIILNDLTSKIFRPSVQPRQLTWQEISSFQRRLHIWYEELPDMILLDAMVLSVHFQIQYFTHQAVMHIFEIANVSQLLVPYGASFIVRHWARHDENSEFSLHFVPTKRSQGHHCTIGCAIGDHFYDCITHATRSKDMTLNLWRSWHTLVM